jgi:hypothetical protein
MQNILVQFTFPDTSIDVYEAIVKDLENEGMGIIPERLYHVSAKVEDGWHVTDVWTSEEAFNKFGETLMPLHVKNGGTLTEPTILAVHNIILP